MGIKIIAKNKRARYDYLLSDTIEAGLELKGTEVKSLRDGKVTIAESHISIRNGEAFIHNMKIPPYEFGNINNHEEARTRKLLLHKDEIANLEHKMQAGGYSIVPTIIYFKGSRVKLEVALGKGKKLHDKRQSEKEKDVKRNLQRGIFD
jgi:SsrA-binding protein